MPTGQKLGSATWPRSMWRNKSRTSARTLSRRFLSRGCQEEEAKRVAEVECGRKTAAEAGFGVLSRSRRGVHPRPPRRSGDDVGTAQTRLQSGSQKPPIASWSAASPPPKQAANMADNSRATKGGQMIRYRHWMGPRRDHDCARVRNSAILCITCIVAENPDC
jgi:hypothetical protein